MFEDVLILKKGGIHIKKKNRGSFTRWCKGKVTEECIRRGKNSSNPAIRKKATFAANARRWKHENGGILKAQEGTGNGFWSKLWNAVKEGGMAARDAKLGAIGAQQVRDLYSEGKNQEAQNLAKQYAKANTTGIALAGGAASTGLLGDLMVTGATTTADTFIDGDTENFGKNLSLNAAFDLVGHGAGKLLRNVDWSKVRNSVESIPDTKADVSEYINTVDDALSERQPLTIQKSSQFWDGTSKSNLTHEEKLGIPKGERSYYKQSLGKSKISPEEKSGVPKGERNNGKYKGITFFRSSHEVPQIDENGFAILTDPDNWFLNTTTDGLLHTHVSYPYLRNHAYAIDPEAFRGSTLFSTEPSDMFFLNSSVKVKPKHVIFISGDEAALKEAAALGYQTMTSPQLKIGFKRSRFGGDYRFKQYDYHKDLRNFVSSHFSRPTIDAYEKISEQTMLPVAVKPFTGKNFVPTGKGVDWSKSDFRHVVYDPASPIEYQFKKQIGLPYWGRSFDSRSLWQRLIQQNRLQDAAKQIQPLKTGGKL